MTETITKDSLLPSAADLLRQFRRRKCRPKLRMDAQIEMMKLAGIEISLMRPKDKDSKYVAVVVSNSAGVSNYRTIPFDALDSQINILFHQYLLGDLKHDAQSFISQTV